MDTSMPVWPIHDLSSVTNQLEELQSLSPHLPNRQIFLNPFFATGSRLKNWLTSFY